MEHFKNLTVYILPSIIICFVYNKIYEKFLFNENTKQKRYMYDIGFILITIYLTILLSSLISPIYGFSSIVNWSNNSNINPLRIINILKEKPISILKNIIIFLPYGLVLSLLCKKINSYTKAIFCGLILSFSIEVIQLFLCVGTDIVHIITATLGTYIGYIIYKILNYFNTYRNMCNKISIYNNIKYLCIYIVLIFISVMCSGFYINYKNLNNIEASNAYLVDIDEKNIIYSKGCNEKIAPASTTKMLTALTVLDYCSEDEIVTVGDEIGYVHEDASTAGLKKGNKLTIKQLLEALLLPSGNDAAYALARYTGEKISDCNSPKEAVETFMIKANKKANSIGASNSNFVRPDGYDTKGQYTTAKDLACIGEKFMKSKILSSIASKYKLNDVLVDGSQVTYENTNELINPYSEYYYSNIKGLKTGSSLDAGKCVVSAADINNKTYICVVMGSTNDGRWLDSLCLYQSIK